MAPLVDIHFIFISLILTIALLCAIYSVSHNSSITQKLFPAQTRTFRKPFFLSVLLLEKNERDGILEFITHYQEEGVDHIYIVDDNSTDGCLDEVRECINSSFITVFPRTQFFPNNSGSKIYDQGTIYTNVLNLVRNQTKWLAVVDADELISSRAYPNRTIRDILLNDLNDCAAIGSPWLLYTWGNAVNLTRNHMRDTMNYRWGFHEKFVRNVPGRFHDRNTKIENKQLFQTDLVQVVHTHHVVLYSADSEICVPHTEPTLACVTNPALSKEVACAGSNRFRSNTSMHDTTIGEDDVDKLILATFHYRVKSPEDFKRKTSSDRKSASRYSASNVSDYNRMDIFDNFMTGIREPSRHQSPIYRRVRESVEQCLHYNDPARIEHFTLTTKKFKGRINKPKKHVHANSSISSTK